MSHDIDAPDDDGMVEDALGGDRNAALQLIGSALMSLSNGRPPAHLPQRYLIEVFRQVLGGESADVAMGLKSSKRGPSPGGRQLTAWRDWAVCARVIERLEELGRPTEIPDDVFKHVAESFDFVDIRDATRRRYYSWSTIKTTWLKYNAKN